MRIRDYVTPERVVIGLQASDRESALRALAERLAASGTGQSEELYEALRAREDAHTTALDRGVAAPHATLESVAEPVVMIATSAQPFQFGPAGTTPVRLLFVLLSPSAQAAMHIRLLARIARLARRSGFVDALAEAASAEELLQRLAAAEPQVA